MIAQNSGKLNKNVNAFGCYLMSLIWWGWYKTNLTVDADLVSNLYTLFQKKGWMTETCFILNPVAILDWMNVDVKEVRKESPIFTPRKSDFLIGQYKADSISHFVCINNDRCVTYDSWWSPEGGSKAVREGKLISLRVFRK